jgi:hypothetical protein
MGKEAPLSRSFEIGDEAYTKHIDHAYDHAMAIVVFRFAARGSQRKAMQEFLRTAPMIPPEMKRKM